MPNLWVDVSSDDNGALTLNHLWLSSSLSLNLRHSGAKTSNLICLSEYLSNRICDIKIIILYDQVFLGVTYQEITEIGLCYFLHLVRIIIMAIPNINWMLNMSIIVLSTYITLFNAKNINFIKYFNFTHILQRNKHRLTKVSNYISQGSVEENQSNKVQ